MDWRTTLSQQVQQMRNDNNSRLRGGYTGPAIRDHEWENKRIDTFMKNQIEHFQAIDLKDLEKKTEGKNEYLKDILLALPSKDFQSILDKYPPVFQIEKADYPAVSIIKCSISGHMLTDLYEAFTKCLTSIKTKIYHQVDINNADNIYNKSTVLKSPNNHPYYHVISRAQALHYIYEVNYIVELLIETGIRHEYIDKVPEIQGVKPVRYYSEHFLGGCWIEKELHVEKKLNPLEIYMKIGTRYLHVFIDSEINKKIDNLIWPKNYGKFTIDLLNRIKHNCLNHIRTTNKINPFSKLELKRQEQELIDAEVERLLKKEQFEKKVLARLEEKRRPVKNTITLKDNIQTYIEDINRWSSLAEL